MRGDFHKKQLEDSFNFVGWYTSEQVDLLSQCFANQFSHAVKSHKKRPVLGLCCVLCGERQFFGFRSLGALAVFLMRVPEVVCFYLYHN